jgi:Bacterial capsule synthesis protein PGA_cap
MRPGRSLLWGVVALLVFSASADATRLPTLPPGHSVTLEWVGDIAMSTELGLPPGGVRDALAPVSKQLHDSDITFGNLEGTLSTGDTDSKCGHSVTGSNCFAFQAPPNYAHGLRALGFRLVNQANNHSMDFGASGRTQTIAALKSAGIAETGYPGQIAYLSTHGIRVAFLGFAPYQFDSDLLNLGTAEAMVRTARRHAALVVVIIHSGAEGPQYDHVPAGDQTYLGEDRGNARAFAHGVIEAGASLVVGSGPHVIRGVEDYQNHLVAYSLGNFVGYHTLGGTGIEGQSAILRVTLGTGGKVLAADWIPIELENGLPRPEPSDASAHLVATLSDEDFPRDHFQVLGSGVFKLDR